MGAGDNLVVPYWWQTSKDLNCPNEWKWVKSPSELPETNADGKRWKVYKRPTKEGIDYYQVPTYELTESSKHNSQKQAGWATAKKAGKIAVPKNGDFSIVKNYGGNWLCEGASISFDGKFWIANCTYVWSPDGWDKDLYDYEEK